MRCIIFRLTQLTLVSTPGGETDRQTDKNCECQTDEIKLG